MDRAALYLRSSKDRADASPAAQRLALHQVAQQRGLIVAAEFVDVVVSGKDDDRPGFQELLRAVRDPRRGWSHLLVLDTARIARRRHLAIIFEHEAAKAGVTVVYRSVPDGDPITTMLLRSIMQAFDEWHSLTARAKGLAGMAENVRRGFRAGGRAPLGYRLEHIDTGAVRDGRPVRKSRLVPGPDFERVRRYLRARAEGASRASAAKFARLEISAASAVGVEWNALTYAGHTVWGVHREPGTGSKRRPRAEWQIQRGTHEAAITDAEAEAIIARLEAYRPSRAGRARGAGYALAGLLVAPDGRRWHGDRGTYRLDGTGRQVQAKAIEQAVIAQVMADLQAPAFVRALLRAARDAAPKGAPPDAARKALARLDREAARLTGLLAETSEPGPLLRRLEAIEGERRALVAQAEQEAAEAAQVAAAAGLTEGAVRAALAALAADLEAVPPEGWRDALAPLVDRIELDPVTRRAVVRYRITGETLASPRGSEPKPVLVGESSFDLPRRTYGTGNR